MSIPTPEAEVTSEPEIEPEGVVEPENEYVLDESNPEPEPYWPNAFPKWGPAWPMHVYVFASLFLIIAILSVSSMGFYLKNKRRLRQGNLTFTLQCLLLLFTLLRSLCLFVDPYQTRGVSTLTFDILWSLALPGLTASFSVLLLVFLDTTKMTLGPPIFQRLSVLLSFTLAHFVIVMMADVVCYLGNACRPMLMFCQMLFVLYGTLLCAGYVYIAIELYKKCSAGAPVVNVDDNRKVVRLIKIASSAALISLSVVVTYAYLAASDFGIYSDVIFVDAWDWWIVQSILRLEELSSACLILVIAFRNPLSEDSKIVQYITKCFSSERQNRLMTVNDNSNTLSKTNQISPMVTTTAVTIGNHKENEPIKGNDT